jgi:hypothetical protein
MLTIDMDDMDSSYNDMQSIDGTKVVLHNVDEYPFEDKNTHMTEVLTANIWTITPTIIEADDSLATLTVAEYFRVSLMKHD